MSPSRFAATTLALLAAVAAATPHQVGAATTPAPSNPLATQQAIIEYLRDPGASGRQLLDAARQDGTAVSPFHELLLADAAARAGLYRTAAAWYADVRDRDLGPQFTSAAEFGLALSALARGGFDEARDHLAAAGAADTAQQPTADFGTTLLDAADGAAAGQGVAATSATDPALAEAASLVGAYARYWAGDMQGATNAFMAFAIAHPDSRYTDDALYASATAKRQAGHETEARDDLEALAGDGHARGRVSPRLLELDPRAVLREGMRRDRELPVRTVSRRLADLLDGDGVRLAQAALEDRSSGDDAADPAPRRKGHRRAAKPVSDQAANDLAAPPVASAPAPAPARGTQAAPSAAPAPRFPWATLAVLVLLALLGSYLLARRTQPRPSGRRR